VVKVIQDEEKDEFYNVLCKGNMHCNLHLKSDIWTTLVYFMRN